ncbi:MAG: signal transduction histidine kinase [Bacteroidetes bacterium]|nr:MAG: signal transduction histidine kinase [Bacteroidota bacterium]
MNESNDIDSLRAEIEALRSENEKLRRRFPGVGGETVRVPEAIRPLFEEAQKTVGEYFSRLKFDPTHGTIEIDEQRYVLVRASSLSYEFLHTIRNLYADRDEKESFIIGRNFLFDIAHVIGLEDAHAFHNRMHLSDPISKLSAGPVHFAYSGWAFVDIHPDSRPSPDENFFLKYDHPFSFEADSWIRAGKKSDLPVCIMNAGYSSGWCEASFGIPLTAVEISCKACGDESCSFIMAPPQRIHEYLDKSKIPARQSSYDVPEFFERKKNEEQIEASLREKEVLLKEVHHRVKNNLQVISSLLNLQSSFIEDKAAKGKFYDSIDRIKSMALLHEMLYRSKDLSGIRLQDYLDNLVDSLLNSYSLVKGKVKTVIAVTVKNDRLHLDKAVPFGLLINELVTNALKYAFEGRAAGEITICLTEEPGDREHFYCLEVKDNGIGLPADISIEQPKTLGLELVAALASQLDGIYTVERSNGTRYSFLFNWS